MRLARRWTATVMVLLLAACGQTVAPPAQDAADAATDDAAGDEVLDDGSAGDVASDAASDTLADAPQDVAVETASDATPDAADVPPDVGQCTIDDDCAAKLTLSPCQLPQCTAGVCAAIKNPDACCLDSDCDDGNECNTHKCDQAQHKCTNAPIANCCSGKVLLQSAGFESGQDGFVSTDGAQNGNVAWQQTAYRAHSGKKSLYFGNACHTYDNSETVVGACAPLLSDATPVATTLLSKTWLLPGNKTKSQAHFWLWLDTEPPYSASMPLGTCSPPCNLASTCILVAGASVCEPEKDVLSLQVLAQDAPPATVFASTQIGKTTLGNPQDPSGWRHIAVDLSSWQGKSIQLAWQFNTKTNAKNTFEGIYLDDVTVETICPDLGKILCNDQQACNDDGVTCTADTCTGYSNVAGTGVCFHDDIAACCLGDVDCDDANACTVDTCQQNACKFQPDAAKTGCCKAGTLQSDDFEKVPLNWTPKDKNSVDVYWRPNPKGGNGGGGSLYFGNATFSNYDDNTLQAGEGPHHTMCSKPLLLDAGTNYKLLKFDLNMDTEWSDVPAAQYVNPPIPGNPKLDWFAVQIVSGGTTDVAWSSDAIQGTTQGKWLPVTVSLDGWAGKSIQVCMHFEAGDGTLNDKPGVNIDNFSVSEACQKLDCYWDTDCASKPCAACQQAVCSASQCTCKVVSGCP